MVSRHLVCAKTHVMFLCSCVALVRIKVLEQNGSRYIAGLGKIIAAQEFLK